MVKEITREDFLTLWRAGVRDLYASSCGNEWMYVRNGPDYRATEGDYMLASRDDCSRRYRFLVEVE